MSASNKIIQILLNAIPIVLMISFIPFFKNDFILTGIYILVMVISFFIKYEKNDHIFFIFGFVAMIISEYFFIKTGVETFSRNSLFGVMPLWLPFLWAYAFVAIKRTIAII